MIESLRYLFAKLNLDKKGQDLTEYGLLVALIAIVVLIAVMVFGGNVSDFFSALADEVGDWINLIP